MGMTISEKILAGASGRDSVRPGEIVKAKVDLAMMPDLTTILSFKAMREMGVEKVWDNEKVVIFLDHVAPASSLQSATVHRDIRRIVSEQKIKHFYDVDSGVCHQVLSERGHVAPGMLIVGADSHTCTHGAMGAFATGIGSTDMGAVLATGRLWFKVPETICIGVEGSLQHNVLPKDLILKIIGLIGADGATYKALEFSGETIRRMNISGRMTLCNMAIEMGGKTGIVEADEETIAFLKSLGVKVAKPVRSDPNASYERVIRLNAGELEPQVACPHKVDNVKPVEKVAGVKIDQVFIGSCTNGRYEDLEVAASILHNRRIHPSVRLIIVPASKDIYLNALKNGIIETLMQAGALVSNPSCGACFGGHIGILAAGEVGLSTSNRNFKGRQGSPEAEVYLSSPATAAASAITGVITDPREV
ncbi:MAG: 3-isopropylmalate dehydratase large subunit [Candidatus Bathyarchaeia archaeon]